MSSATEIQKQNIVFFPENGHQMCQDLKAGKSSKF